MDKIKQRQNRGYLIAGIGALVALLAFLLLPYVIITVSAAVGRLSYYVAVTYNATALTQSSSNGANGIPNSSQIQNQGALWLLPILALVALVLTGLLVFRDHPFGKGINAPLAMQRRWGNYGLIGIAALSVLIQIVLFSNLNSQIQNAVNASNSSSNPTAATVSTGPHVGFWLFLLSMAAVAAGAIFLLVQESKQTQVAQPVPNMSGGQSYQPWQSPAPLDPYSQPYPPQQAQPYPPQQQEPYPPQQPQQAQPYPPQQAQPYPPQQPQQAQPYPPQQWPPSSNPPQSPYPPGQ